MNIDPNGNSLKSLWESVSEWFNNTFGYATYKEKSITSWYGIYEIRSGIGYGTNSKKPVVLYTSIPDKWWKLDQYSIGLKFTGKKEKRFKIFIGTNIGFGSFNKNGGNTLSLSVLGRIVYRQSSNTGNGSYMYLQGNVNLPEILAVLVVIYYLNESTSSIPANPEPLYF